MANIKTTFKPKPDWAGSDWLSKWVNVLIQTKPIYRMMKHQARQVLIRTAEKNGIPWQQTYRALERAGLSSLFDSVINPQVTYPDYYRVPFHAYDQGNLCWAAAFEAESATYSMGLRVWPQEKLTWQAAGDRLRASFHQAVIQQLWPDDLGAKNPGAKNPGAEKTTIQQATPVRNILDVGCSVGISTRSLHQFFLASQAASDAVSEAAVSHAGLNTVGVNTTGLDLSPYMLAVAQYRDVNQEIAAWVHGNAEQTEFADGSFDLVTLQFVLHELPRQASQAIFREMWRLLRPGGCFALLDNNPQSPVIQNLSPVLFTLMKSTEPWSDDYYTFDVEAALKQTGFVKVTTVSTDPRHRTITATKPGELSKS